MSRDDARPSPASSSKVGRLPGIHGGCDCSREHWRVVQYHYHRSAFAGYRDTWSAYSRVRCNLCGHTWRTKAQYVDSLSMA